MFWSKKKKETVKTGVGVRAEARSGDGAGVDPLRYAFVWGCVQVEITITPLLTSHLFPDSHTMSCAEHEALLQGYFSNTAVCAVEDFVARALAESRRGWESHITDRAKGMAAAAEIVRHGLERPGE